MVRSRSRSPAPRRGRSPSRSRSFSPPPSKPVIRVGRLTKNVSAAHLDEIFGCYGKILDVDLPINRNLGTHKGTAWITFAQRAVALKAIDCMDGGQVDGTEISVVEEPPSPPPRRLLAEAGAEADPGAGPEASAARDPLFPAPLLGRRPAVGVAKLVLARVLGRGRGVEV